MLCCNSADGQEENYIEDVNGLSTLDALQWLLRLPPNHEYGGYYLSYDWTMILKDLPKHHIYRLLRPELRARCKEEGGGFTDIRWKGFRLHYLSGMMQIRRGKRKVRIWDVGKYYQSRFVAALEQSGIAPPDIISRMKGERGGDVWNEEYLDTIREYCLEECKYLAQLCELLQQQHEAIGLKTTTWHGPGSTASAVLKLHGIKDHLDSPPKEVEHIANCAYFGGRFELSSNGSKPDVWQYDIRSAYPHAISTLPCLMHAQWHHVTRPPARDELALVRYKVRDIGERAWGPLPCRLSSGSIVWPRSGSSGWIWSGEYWQAIDGWDGIEYGNEAWVLERKCVCTPFSFVPELYAWRVSRPENKQVVKLALNSMYGKMAQTAGGGSRFSSRVWAGMITSSCRARMLDLIRRHTDDRAIYGIATDGLFSAEHHDIDTPELGGWEVTHKGAVTFLRPGIYWSDADVAQWQDAPDETLFQQALRAVKARGIGRRQMLLQAQAASEALRTGVERARLGTTRLFGGARHMVYRTPSGQLKRSRLYGEWFDAPASLSLKPEPKRDGEWRPPALSDVESAPYRPHHGLDAQMLRLIGQLLHERL